MVAINLDTPPNDDTTQLVLDMVQKVFDPPPAINSTFMRREPLRQNFQSNINSKNFNAAAAAPSHVTYKRWSVNDGGGLMLAVPQHKPHFPAHNGAMHANNQLNHVTAQYNRPHQTNFWDKYSSSSTSNDYYPVNNNNNIRNNYASNGPLLNNNNNQYLNSKCMPKNSWRDNSVFSANKFITQQQQLPFLPSLPIPRTDNSYFQFRKINRKCCSFCKKNGESYEFYTSHSLYEDGKPFCPILKQCICHICGQRGHTMSHCNLNASKNSILKLITRFNSMK